MKKLFVTNKRKLAIFIALFIALTILFFFAVYAKWIDLGIDTLTRPQKGREFYEEDIEGQLHIQSVRSKYNVGDTIVFTLNTAYVDLPEQAELIEYAYFHLIHSEYLEVEVVDASERYPVPEPSPDVDPNYSIPANDIDYLYRFTEFDPSEMVYRPVGVFNSITRSSLPFSVEITVKVREDAPESFTDELFILTGARGDVWYTEYYFPVSDYPKGSRISVRIVRDGDTVKIYA